MTTTMRAERFYADTKKVVLEDVPIPEPGPGEVLVKVAFCGICHSDLSLINGTFPTQTPVVTQGHEASGTVAKLGPDIQWVESFVAADKTFCVYLAKDEAIIKKHAEISGFPASKITEVRKMIDPTTERDGA